MPLHVTAAVLTQWVGPGWTGLKVGGARGSGRQSSRGRSLGICSLWGGTPSAIRTTWFAVGVAQEGGVTTLQMILPVPSRYITQCMYVKVLRIGVLYNAQAVLPSKCWGIYSDWMGGLIFGWGVCTPVFMIMKNTAHSKCCGSVGFYMPDWWVLGTCYSGSSLWKPNYAHS